MSSNSFLLLRMMTFSFPNPIEIQITILRHICVEMTTLKLSRTYLYACARYLSMKEGRETLKRGSNLQTYKPNECLHHAFKLFKRENCDFYIRRIENTCNNVCTSHVKTKRVAYHIYNSLFVPVRNNQQKRSVI